MTIYYYTLDFWQGDNIINLKDVRQDRRCKNIFLRQLVRQHTRQTTYK